MKRHNISKRDEPPSEALQALKDFGREREEHLKGKELREAEKEKKQKLWVICQWVILAISTAIIIFQIPKVISAYRQGEKPLRNGTYATDEITDSCITNLWKIAAMIQQRKLNIDAISDPASKKPYKVTETKDDVIVRTPHPELYGFREMQVSKNNPVPELLK